MAHDIIFLLMGFALIILGGNYVTDGAVAVANKMKISPVIVGLTIVAFGSSTPDLVISVFATAQGKSELAIGDIVGAGIFDMLLVVGITAMIRPIKLSKSAIWYDLPTMAIGALIIFVCAQDRIMKYDSVKNVLDRVDGIVMLLLFVMFMIYTISHAHDLKPNPTQSAPAPTQQHAPAQQPTPQTPAASNAQTAAAKTKAASKPIKMWLAVTFIVGGLAALVLGGNWIVDGASGIAKKVGMSEAMIGLTVVAFGSSVPDLAASVMAALKGQSGLAMGNVLGACIMDMLFVLGTCAVIHPLDAGHVTIIDFGTLAVASIILLLMGLFNRKHQINRTEGIILAVCYIAYLIYLIGSAAK